MTASAVIRRYGSCLSDRPGGCFLRGLPAAFLLLLLPAASSPAGEFALRLLGQYEVPTGTRFADVEFGGISGLERAADGTYWALSDARGGRHGGPRVYSLSLDYGAEGFRHVAINGLVWLRQPDGSLFPHGTPSVDPESIRLAPGGTLYWSSEGIWHPDAALRRQPFIGEMLSDGTFVRSIAFPAMFHYQAGSGGRSNHLFEALAVAPDGMLWVGSEGALIQDGPLSSLERGSNLRITALDPAGVRPAAQYVYPLPPVPLPAKTPGGASDNGLTELLALSSTSFLAVERGHADGAGNTIRLTRIDLAGATDVLQLNSLENGRWQPVQRRLLLDLATLGIEADNIEALTWGRRLANGNATLVLASDNNFNTRQVSQFIALEVVPEE